MKFSCPDCAGHVLCEAPYDGAPVVCPHCAATVALLPLPDAPLAQLLPAPDAAALPPVLAGSSQRSLAELAGPNQPLDLVAQMLTLVARYLTPGEHVMRIVVQSKLMSLSLVPDLVAATTRRLIIVRRGIFSCQLWDALWIDIADVQVSESFSGATLLVRLVTGAAATLDRLPKDAARDFYRFCQAAEEQMRLERYGQRAALAAAGASQVNVQVGRL